MPVGHAGILARFGHRLPLTDRTAPLSLGEGDTPLVRSARVERQLGLEALYFKLEGSNPTGSFKDRGMVVAVAKAVEEGRRAVLCASTGNTSASAAAYAARAGLEAVVLVPAGYIALGKLAQALAYGARVVAIRGNFDDALRLVRELAARQPLAIVNSINPYRLEGQKTAAFEVNEVLGRAPDLLALPVGNAGNITAYWRGFCEDLAAGRTWSTPRLLGFQAAGAAPIVVGHPIARPETVATAIRIGNPASWQPALRARDESGGLIAAVGDEEILDAWRLLASSEGLFVEPSSAAGLAGLRKLHREGALSLTGLTAVCVLTGHGLKDPQTAIDRASGLLESDADVRSVERALGW